MMKYQIVISGFGGQGTVFLIKLLSICASNKSLKFLGTETHGMSQRGGTVASFIKFGNIHSPLISLNQADLLLGLDPVEVLRFTQYLGNNGSLVTNGNNDFPQLDWNSVAIDANQALAENNFPVRGLNVFMIGVVLATVAKFPFSVDEIKQSIQIINPKVAKQNLAIFELGYSIAKGLKPKKRPSKKQNSNE